METRIDHVTGGIYRISTWTPEYGITFNQFVVMGDEPLLFHTGTRRLFASVRDAVAGVVDPASIRWISFSGSGIRFMASASR